MVAPRPASSLLLCLWAATIARADGPVLHEYVPDVDPHEAVLAVGRADGSEAAIVYDGEVLPAPELNAADARLAPMLAGEGDGAFGEEAGRRSPTFRPDRQTELEGTLSYYAAFNPAIAPFKRVTSLDRIVLAEDGVTPVLVVGDARRRRVSVGSPDDDADPGQARDRFWGEARLDFSAGDTVPLPSVAPDSRILSLRTEPRVALTILRDGADNLFARLPKGARGALGAAGATVAVSFLTDAPRAYFGMEVPERSMASLRPALHALPASVRARGLRFAAELGLTPDSGMRKALHGLVAHFRAFEESAEPPTDTGDVYLDLARAQRGVCRHRAYAFVVTAQALGMLARFVQNEAHSWVEVWIPDGGFMRIDLGGAAHGLQAHGADDRPLYQPVEPDRLPRPPVYEESYSQLGPSAQGFRQPDDAALEGRWLPPDEGAPAASMPADQGTGARKAQAGPGDPSAAASAAGQSVSAPTAAASSQAGRIPLSVVVDQRQSRVLRGRTLSVTGRVTGADGLGVAGQRVEMSLAAPDRRERLLLGVTVSAPDGYFRAALGIPPDLEVGDYGLIVIAPGDDRHLPGVAP